MAKEKCGCCDCECSKEKLLKVYFCPKCKSTSVRYVFGFRNLFGVVPRMQCEDCSFSASVFPQFVELPKKKANVKKVIKKLKKGGRI